MSVHARVLFDSPRSEIASLLVGKLAESVFTQVVTGFATESGLAVIEQPIANNPSSLNAFITGAGTYKAFDAFDRLIRLGVPQTALRIHLGHTRNSGNKVRDQFRPMLHSKIYYMEKNDGTASAIIGSHNVTGFAMLGLNGEAAVLLEGDKNSPEFVSIRRHIETAKSEAAVYSPDMKEALSWWTQQYLGGLTQRAREGEGDKEDKKTIVILSALENAAEKINGVLYFELPKEVQSLTSLRADIHLYVFARLPATPDEALLKLSEARRYSCRMVALDVTQGSTEIEADWCLIDSKSPVLRKTSRPFRPQPKTDMQQVRVDIKDSPSGSYEYFFDESPSWQAVSDPDCRVKVAPNDTRSKSSADKRYGADDSWLLVKGLASAEPKRHVKNSTAFRKMSPKEGTFVVMSLRRKIKEHQPS